MGGKVGFDLVEVGDWKWHQQNLDMIIKYHKKNLISFILIYLNLHTWSYNSVLLIELFLFKQNIFNFKNLSIWSIVFNLFGILWEWNKIKKDHFDSYFSNSKSWAWKPAFIWIYFLLVVTIFKASVKVMLSFRIKKAITILTLLDLPNWQWTNILCCLRFWSIKS